MQTLRRARTTPQAWAENHRLSDSRAPRCHAALPKAGVEFNLHVHYVSHARLRSVPPYCARSRSPSKRNLFCDPGYIHAAYRLPTEKFQLAVLLILRHAVSFLSGGTLLEQPGLLGRPIKKKKKDASVSASFKVYFIFLTLKFRISNERGVPRQLSDIYFCSPLSNLQGIPPSDPLDKASHQKSTNIASS